MNSSTDSIVTDNDWSKVTLSRKWWFQAVMTFLVMPVGLALILLLPAYQNRKGRIERISKGTKSILVVLVVLVVGFNAARWIASQASVDLVITDRGILGIWIKNIGSTPVEIRHVTINDRPECTRPQPAKIVKVGDIVAWPSECFSKARATIKTDQGDYTYSFDR